MRIKVKLDWQLTCFLSLDPSVWRRFGDIRNRVKVSVQEVEEVEQGVEAFNQIAV